MENILGSDETESVWEQVAPHLNDALDKLSRHDREAILIRFFQDKSHKEMVFAQVNLGGRDGTKYNRAAK